MSSDHNFWRERRAVAVSNRGPSAYQPNALPLGHTGSQPLLSWPLFIYPFSLLLPKPFPVFACRSGSFLTFSRFVFLPLFHRFLQIHFDCICVISGSLRSPCCISRLPDSKKGNTILFVSCPFLCSPDSLFVTLFIFHLSFPIVIFSSSAFGSLVTLV